MRKVLLFVSFFSVSMVLGAVEHRTLLLDYGKITSIIIYTDNGNQGGHTSILIGHENIATLQNADQTLFTAPNKAEIVLKKDHPFYKEVLTILLTARTSGKNVRITISNEIHDARHVVKNIRY